MSENTNISFTNCTWVGEGIRFDGSGTTITGNMFNGDYVSVFWNLPERQAPPDDDPPMLARVR